MNEGVFERDLRAVLLSYEPVDVPRSLDASIAALPNPPQRRAGWLGRSSHLDRRSGVERVASFAVAGVTVVALFVVGVIIVAGFRRPEASVGAGSAPRAFTWGTQLAVLEADTLSIEVDGRTFHPPADVAVVSDPGTPTYRTLEMSWHEQAREMRVFIYFAADAESWWVSEIRTYDGRSTPAWAYFAGLQIGAARGASFEGSVDALGTGRGGTARLRIENLRLTAFQPGTAPEVRDCRAVGPARGWNPLAPPVPQPGSPNLSEFGVAPGMDARDVAAKLRAQQICHTFRLEFPAINRGQVWCVAPPGNVQEFAFGSSGEVIVFIEDASPLPLDTELPQVVGC